MNGAEQPPPGAVLKGFGVLFMATAMVTAAWVFVRHGDAPFAPRGNKPSVEWWQSWVFQAGAFLVGGALTMLLSSAVGIAAYLGRGDGPFFPDRRDDALIGWGHFVAALVILFVGGVRALWIGVQLARDPDRREDE